MPHNNIYFQCKVLCFICWFYVNSHLIYIEQKAKVNFKNTLHLTNTIFFMRLAQLVFEPAISVLCETVKQNPWSEGIFVTKATIEFPGHYMAVCGLKAFLCHRIMWSKEVARFCFAHGLKEVILIYLAAVPNCFMLRKLYDVYLLQSKMVFLLVEQK